MLVVVRFGLHGFPGGAQDARRVAGVRRQATSDRLNRSIQLLAAELAMQPLVPIPRPSLSKARREEIIGTVLSTLGGPPEDHAMRAFIHATVRKDLLRQPARPISTQDATARKRWNRAAHEWIAVASHHLDRDVLPWSSYPTSDPASRREMDAWLASSERLGTVLSVGALRELTRHGVRSAIEKSELSPANLLGMLTDGYRPLIELVRVAKWASGEDHGLPVGPDGYPEAIPDSTAMRVQVLSILAQMVALRGYHDLALAYVGRASEIALVGTPGQRASPLARFQVGLAYESISFLMGPRRIDETRRWHRRLASDIDRFGVQNDVQPLALAQAMIRAEHNAAIAGLATTGSVSELLAPIREALMDCLARHPEENRQRFSIVAGALAKELDDYAFESPGGVAGRSAEAPTKAPAVAYDEWYVASSVATTRWDRRRTRKSVRNQWRR